MLMPSRIALYSSSIKRKSWIALIARARCCFKITSGSTSVFLSNSTSYGKTQDSASVSKFSLRNWKFFCFSHKVSRNLSLVWCLSLVSIWFETIFHLWPYFSMPWTSLIISISLHFMWLTAGALFRIPFLSFGFEDSSLIFGKILIRVSRLNFCKRICQLGGMMRRMLQNLFRT